ncbi:MAG: cytochrome c maturation protein CcmE [bacterium]|nr:cytochrome c maturation protein CcmE [bacterium]
MQKRYVIAGIVIVALAAVAWFALGESSIEYADVARAEKLGKTVQVVGTWVKEEGSKYDESGNLFTFHMNDEKGKRVFVELNGAKPNNFEIATSIVVRGRMEGSTFKATHILTKCPSKYEGAPVTTEVKS